MWTNVFKHAPSKRRRMFEKELNTVASLCSLFMYRWDPQKGISNSTVLAGQWRSVAPEWWKNPPPHRNMPEKRPEQSTASYSYLCGTVSLLQHTCNISQIDSGDFPASPSSDESAEIIKRVAGQGRIQMPNLHHGNWEWNIYIKKLNKNDILFSFLFQIYFLSDRAFTEESLLGKGHCQKLVA